MPASSPGPPTSHLSGVARTAWATASWAVIGTLLGVAAALPVALLDPPAGVLAVVGGVAFVAALTQAKKTYWLMYGLYTFSLILLLGAPGQVAFEAEERGVEILVGVGILVVGLFIVHTIAGRLAERDPQPELAPSPA